jgi:hypothetical protein
MSDAPLAVERRSPITGVVIERLERQMPPAIAMANNGETARRVTVAVGRRMIPVLVAVQMPA